MESNCGGCIQKAIELNAERLKIEDLAQVLANETKEWVGIYEDNEGTHYAVGESAVGKPIKAWFTPNMPDTSV